MVTLCAIKSPERWILHIEGELCGLSHVPLTRYVRPTSRATTSCSGSISLDVGWYDDVMTGKCSPYYWSSVRGTHRSPMHSHHKAPVVRNLDIFFDVNLNKPLNNQVTGDLRRSGGVSRLCDYITESVTNSITEYHLYAIQCSRILHEAGWGQFWKWIKWCTKYTNYSPSFPHSANPPLKLWHGWIIAHHSLNWK